MHFPKRFVSLFPTLIVLSNLCFFEQQSCSAQVIDRLGGRVDVENLDSQHDTLSITNNNAPTGPTLLGKLTRLRDSVASDGMQTRFSIRRGEVYADTLEQIMDADPVSLRLQPYVEFEGERGIDERGLSRALFTMVSREMTHPSRKLFYKSTDGEFQINPKSKALREFRFVGRIFGMSVLHDLMLGVHFVPTLFKLIQGNKLTLADLEIVDPGLHKSLSRILYSKIHTSLFGVLLSKMTKNTGLTMSATIPGPDGYETVELVPGGKNIRVTNINKEQYVDLHVQYILMTQYKDQIEAIQEGLYDIIPKAQILEFQSSDLKLIISGSAKIINVDDLKRLATYDQYEDESDVIKWFWECVSEWDAQQRADLLEFVTGSPSVPPVETRNSNTGLFVIQKTLVDLSYLPVAYACTKTLELPPYTSKNALCSKLGMSLEYGQGFYLA